MPDLNVTQIAHICHEANRALQLEQNDPSIPVAPAWEDLDGDSTMSIIIGVTGVIEGLDPEQSHASWLGVKLAQGWTFGPMKSIENKTHPLLIPYDELPPEQKLKDDLFAAIVHALT